MRASDLYAVLTYLIFGIVLGSIIEAVLVVWVGR